MAAASQTLGPVGEQLSVQNLEAVPRAGISLLRLTEERAVHVRAAARALSIELAAQKCRPTHCCLLAPRILNLAPSIAEPEAASELAWYLTAEWLLGVVLGELSTAASLQDAEEWFLGNGRGHAPMISRLVSQGGLRAAAEHLRMLPIDSALVALLPHILDDHGPGARSTVLRDPSAHGVRRKRKAAGVFYTPSDVAEFIVRRSLEGLADKTTTLRVFDPACGTGVFLLSALAEQQSATPERSPLTLLFGIDTSSLAVNAACFSILLHSFRLFRRMGTAPWSAWHAIRLNFAVADALSIESPARDETSQLIKSKKGDISKSLLGNAAPEPWVGPARLSDPPIGPLFGGDACLPLDYLLPDLRDGADIVVGNPPYSKLGQRSDFPLLKRRFACLRDCRGTGAENVYPMFVEMLWRMGRPGNTAGGMVVPLSLAYHRGSQYEMLREAMEMHGGEYRFAFFDREPSALFGEEVKTRNAIVLRFGSTEQRGVGSAYFTGPLNRWTSRTRFQMFAGISYTAIPTVTIRKGIPKLSGPTQAKAYARLTSIQDSLKSLCKSITSAPPRLAVGKTFPGRLFVGGTAYSFINVFRCHPVVKELYPLADGSVHMIHAETETLARAIFAILSSQLVFWYWHVLGDGFHLPRWFLNDLPFGRCTLAAPDIERLAVLGHKLWEGAKRDTITSVNGGRQSIAYRPTRLMAARREVDRILLAATGIEEQFVCELSDYVRNAVLVDALDSERISRLGVRPDWFEE